MRVYVGQTRSRALIRKCNDFGLGECTNRGMLPPRRNLAWFLDNGAYADHCTGRAFDAVRWTRDLWWIAYRIEAGVLPRPPDFIVVPDIVGGGLRSLAFSMDHVCCVPKELPTRYLVVQEGMTPDNVGPFIHHFQGLFVGGADIEWKLSTSPAWVRLAHQRGLRCHIGRIGTPERLVWAHSIGADSIDSNWPLSTVPRLEAFAAAAAACRAELATPENLETTNLLSMRTGANGVRTPDSIAAAPEGDPSDAQAQGHRHARKDATTMAKQLKLEDMNLADLQAKYKGVTGKSSKSRDKTFLIKAIQEAEVAKKKDAPTGRRAQIATAARGRTPRGQAADEESRRVEPPAAQGGNEPGPSAEEPVLQEAASPMPEAETEALEGDVTEPEVDQVLAAVEPAGAAVEVELEPGSDVADEVELEPGSDAADEPDEVEEPSSPSGDGGGGEGNEEVIDASDGATPPTTGVDKKKLAKMTVEELQQLYAEKVKRPTGSTNTRYLIWKIDQVAKGRVAAGPAHRANPTVSRAARRFADTTTGELQEQYEAKTGTATESLDRDFLIAGILAASKTEAAANSKRYGSTKEKQVLPFGLDTPVVQTMDAAWQRIGYPTRVAFFRKACQRELLHHGEVEAAAMFSE